MIESKLTHIAQKFIASRQLTPDEKDAENSMSLLDRGNSSKKENLMRLHTNSSDLRNRSGRRSSDCLTAGLRRLHRSANANQATPL